MPDYEYSLFPLAIGTSFHPRPGNFILCKEEEPQVFVALFVGETSDLSRWESLESVDVEGYESHLETQRFSREFVQIDHVARHRTILVGCHQPCSLH